MHQKNIDHEKYLHSMYASDRVEKISRIMPSFAEVAQVGDTVNLGLVGDPLFPDAYTSERPMATISAVDHHQDGTTVTLTHGDGRTQVIPPGSLAPNQVWEYTDNAFEKVLQREHDYAARAEEAVMPEPPDYRGTDDLRREVQQLRADLEAERALRQDFNNTYIETLKEFSHDIIGVANGSGVTFATMFSEEYDKMRAESSLYRGATSSGSAASPAASDAEFEDYDDGLSEASMKENLTDFF